MSLWGNIKNITDPQVKADVDFARNVDPTAMDKWPSIENVLRRYFNVGGIRSAASRCATSDATLLANKYDWMLNRRCDSIPKEIERLCEEWYGAVVDYNVSVARQGAIEAERYINRHATIAAQSREAEARDEAERLRRALRSSAGEKEKVEEELRQREFDHKKQLDEHERIRSSEVASLRDEIGELRIELARAEVKADEQRRARKMDYLNTLEGRLKELERR